MDIAVVHPRSPNDPVLARTGRWLSTLNTPGCLLVAVSGGSDSTGLLMALHAAIDAKPCGLTLAACTIDHDLRAGSAKEAEAVGALCRKLGIRHHIRRWTGEKPATGLQAAARMARYRLLCDVADETGAIAIVTGHTADDQAETIAMRAARGDGPGLAGMADAVLAFRRHWVLRPFLSLCREAIREYLSDIGQDWMDDPSNANLAYERVRLRANTIDPALLASGAATADRRAIGAQRAAGLIAVHVRVFHGLVAVVSPELAQMADDADALSALLSLAAVLGGRSHLLSEDTARRIAAFLASGSNGRMTAGRTVFDRRGSGLYLYRERRDLPETLVAPFCRAVWDGRFSIENRAPTPIQIRPVSDPEGVTARLVSSGLPEAIARRAAPCAPECVMEPLSSHHPTLLHYHIGLYDTFLPRFDLRIADQIARLFEAKAYRALPFSGCDVLNTN